MLSNSEVRQDKATSPARIKIHVPHVSLGLRRDELQEVVPAVTPGVESVLNRTHPVFGDPEPVRVGRPVIDQSLVRLTLEKPELTAASKASRDKVSAVRRRNSRGEGEGNLVVGEKGFARLRRMPSGSAWHASNGVSREIRIERDRGVKSVVAPVVGDFIDIEPVYPSADQLWYAQEQQIGAEMNQMFEDREDEEIYEPYLMGWAGRKQSSHVPNAADPIPWGPQAIILGPKDSVDLGRDPEKFLGHAVGKFMRRISNGLEFQDFRDSRV